MHEVEQRLIAENGGKRHEYGVCTILQRVWSVRRNGLRERRLYGYDDRLTLPMPPRRGSVIAQTRLPYDANKAYS